MKIITAIGLPNVNEALKEIEECNVIGTDIQYQEGIIEALEEIEDIDCLVLSNNLPGEYNFNILINKIKEINGNIEIIVFLKEKNIDLENFLNSKGIYKIYYFNMQDFKIFFSNFTSNSKDFYKELSNEITELKSYILSNNSKKAIRMCKTKTAKVNKEIRKATKNVCDDSKIIVITGAFGVGKSIISTILAKLIEVKKKKVLLVDFDIFNNSIHTILGINKKCENNNLGPESFIKKVKDNFDVFLNTDIFYAEKSSKRQDEFKEDFRKLKEKYDFIIIDTTSNINYRFVKMILSNCDKLIFLIEPNLCEIKKANNILELYLKDFEIDIDKIKIIFNKVNKYGIADSILEELFGEFEIIGNIKYNEKYNLLINKNLWTNFDIDKYEEIYENLNK